MVLNSAFSYISLSCLYCIMSTASGSEPIAVFTKQCFKMHL